MERILFVDENRNVLDGFERVLFKMRKEWEMEFVTSGEEALERLEQKPYSAIVCDTGMSGITGIDVMQIVRENHPEIARIIVSEHADIKDLMDALGAAHQFLAKPIEPVLLRDTLIKVLALLRELKDENLRRLINRIHTLPNQPELHLELLQAISSGSLREIAAIIEKDPVITTRVLQLANSPFLGIRQQITNVQQAVSLLGVDILKGLVLSVEIFSRFRLDGSSRRELDEIFQHCTEVANYARIISLEMTGNRELANDAYIAGMVHDIGKLIILTHFQHRYFEIKEECYVEQEPFYKIEQKRLGVDHSRIGAYLMGLWGLPQLLVETAAYHHKPSFFVERGFSPMLAVHIADAIKRSEVDEFPVHPDTGIPLAIELSCLDNLGLTKKLPSAVKKIHLINEIHFS